MAVLVLGGAGYIGCHTVYELIEHGRDVVALPTTLSPASQGGASEGPLL